LLGAAAALFAQAGSGTITGTVTDPSGAVVPGAAIVTNTNTGVAHSLTTNDAGIYMATFLQPDDYTVTASKAGHTNACLVPSPLFMTRTATSSLISGSRQVQVSARLTF
jgi:hypothetical protein